MAVSRSLSQGVYAATLTFFDANEKLDRDTQRTHAIRLAESGCAGIVALGSNDEAPHLSIEERNTVVRDIRAALDSVGKLTTPIITGCSDQSVHLTVNLIREAVAAGSDYALVLPPTYFAGAMSPEVIESYFRDVAEESPVPILIYSFPAVSAGISMDSNLIIRISQHPNVIGTKFTCGDTGKLNRVALAMKACSTKDYITLGGLADFILPAMVAGATGVIAGGANITPHACVKVFDCYRDGKIEEATEIQAVLAQGDNEHTSKGIQGTKGALQSFYGYGGSPRRPLRSLSSAAVAEMAKQMEGLMALEERLSREII